MRHHVGPICDDITKSETRHNGCGSFPRMGDYRPQRAVANDCPLLLAGLGGTTKDNTWRHSGVVTTRQKPAAPRLRSWPRHNSCQRRQLVVHCHPAGHRRVIQYCPGAQPGSQTLSGSQPAESQTPARDSQLNHKHRASVYGVEENQFSIDDVKISQNHALCWRWHCPVSGLPETEVQRFCKRLTT